MLLKADLADLGRLSIHRLNDGAIGWTVDSNDVLLIGLMTYDAGFHDSGFHDKPHQSLPKD
jgi:hypothetical protein